MTGEDEFGIQGMFGSTFKF